MNEPYLYEIRIQGRLSEDWSEWFDGMAIASQSGKETTLSGWLVDQAALLGVLGRIHALNLTLISVSRSERPESGP